MDKAKYRRWKPDWDEANMRSAQERARVTRWSYKAKSMVVHPEYGEVIVPHGSNFSAVICAAEVWSVPFTSVLDAKVVACDQSLPVNYPAGGMCA